MSGLGFSDDFQEWHTCPVVVDQDLVALIHGLCSVLLHLDPLNQNMGLVVLIVIEEESAILHYGVVLLGDLVGLWQVCIDIMLSVKFDLWEDATSKGKGGFDGDVKTLLVQNREHTGETNVDQVCIRVWLIEACAKRG